MAKPAEALTLSSNLYKSHTDPPARHNLPIPPKRSTPFGLTLYDKHIYQYTGPVGCHQLIINFFILKINLFYAEILSGRQESEKS